MIEIPQKCGKTNLTALQFAGNQAVSGSHGFDVRQ
jgi:hypothetical protein